MSGVVEYDIGVPVACSDGVCGDLVRVVYDPVARAITHLVVQRKHRPGEGRLVPVELIDESTGEIRLRCSTSEFDELEYAEETHFISESGEDLGYERGEVYMWPYYGVGAGIDAPPMLGPQAFFSSRVPAGEVEVRRGERVHAVDGDIGRVHGFAVDPEDHHVTHVLLEEGHLWGRKEIAIPIGAVTEVNADGVRVVLTRAQVRDLPPVDLAGSR